MQVKKLLQVCAKNVQQKTPYVKPQYKTYKELLKLDRPKIAVQNQSDNQNDDFLEKLFKKQEKKQKQQKQKQKLKTSTSKKSKACTVSQTSAKVLQATLNQTQKKQKQQTRIVSSKSYKHVNIEDRISIKRKNQTEQIVHIEMRTPQKSKQLSHNQQNNSDVILKHKTSIIVKKRRNLSQANLKPNLNYDFKQKNIIVDNSSYPIIRFVEEEFKSVQNRFISSLSLRRSNATLQLQKYAHQGINKQDGHNLRLIESKLNPQTKQILHHVSLQKPRKQKNHGSSTQKMQRLILKNASKSPIQMALQAKAPSSLSNKPRPSFLKPSNSLFKSAYQQQLFLSSLKGK